MAKLFLLLAVCACTAFSAPNGPISQSLIKEFETKDRTTIVISLKSGVGLVYHNLAKKTFVDSVEKTTVLRSSLISNAESTQSSLLAFLKSKSLSYKAFWITNRVFVKNADYSLVQQLATRDDVLEIRAQHQASVSPILSKSFEITQNPNQWGVDKVKAGGMWDQGYKGEGIRVSSIDTGVRGTHEILAGNFFGDYGWYDPVYETDFPEDNGGHGTHTMGTIAGQNGYGVAPGAKWMSCTGCSSFACWEEDLIACAEYVFCPHLWNKTNADCSKKPHLVSNSWGSSLGGQDWYDEPIKAWHEASIIPIFSAGNSGPSCGTVGSPGDRDVIAVGATDIDNTIAYFSSVGPATGTTDHKPDISAPGVDVISSYNSGDKAYTSMSGTSMACPHVAGSVALLLQKDPTLIGSMKKVLDALRDGAVKSGLTGNNNACGGNPETEFPNFTFGNGLVDVLASGNLRNQTVIR